MRRKNDVIGSRGITAAVTRGPMISCRKVQFADWSTLRKLILSDYRLLLLILIFDPINETEEDEIMLRCSIQDTSLSCPGVLDIEGRA